MTTKINFNGQIEENPHISVYDHGFLFGDSVYEVVCTRHGNPCFLDRHLKRLKKSADAIALNIPYDTKRFHREIEKTLKATGNAESYIRIVVTRGVGEIDIDPSSCLHPNVLIYVTTQQKYPEEYYEKGIEIAVVSIKRNPREALNPGIKTGNYLNNVLAKLEANKLGAKDALMLSPWGFLTECTTSNFFFVQGERLMTPSIECGILAGITRDFVLEIAVENGIQVEEGKWPPDVLEKAEEMFLTGTLKKVLPVTRLNGKIVSDGKPGPITRRLMRLHEAVMEKLG